MSARHFITLNLSYCACGRMPVRRLEFAGGATLHWVICPGCGAHTRKHETESDADSSWNDGEVLQAWHLPTAPAAAEVLQEPA